MRPMRRNTAIGVLTATLRFVVMLAMTSGLRTTVLKAQDPGHPITRSGELPQVVFARVQAERRGQVETWRGTSITPEEDVDGQELVIQEEVATLFAKADPCPDDRAQHFAWCDVPGMRLNGWYGRIRQMKSIPGGWHVEIQVSPHITTELGNVSFTRDYRIEVYETGPNGLRYVTSRRPPDAVPGITFVD